MFEVINQAWLLTITSPTTACSPTVKAREIHSATPAACTVRHILLLLHFLTERVTGCQMKCSFISYHQGTPDYNISQFRSSPKKHKCSLGHLCFYIAVRKICYVSSMNDTRATIHPAELLILLQMNTTHSGLAFTLCHHQCQINETIRESPFIVVPRQNFDHITANHQR